MLEAISNWIINLSGNHRIVTGMLSNDISQAFCLTIIAYLCCSLFLVWRGEKGQITAALVANAPGILTSLGILGTFTGIFVGLIEFKIESINSSVSQLLEGLKVAFGTSILGLGSALVFRFLGPFLEPDTSDSSVTAQDLLKSLKNIESQIETSRTILQKGFDTQIHEFRQFADQMSKAFSDAIIKELKGVIREFNDKLSEQFGENFKQLNEAVGRLLVWQENYRTQLEELKKSFDIAIESLKATETALVNVEHATSSLPEHAQKLSEASHELGQQIKLLHQGLASIEEMRTRAEGAIPNIAGSISSMTDTINLAVENQRQTTEAIKDAVTSSVSDQRAAQQQMLEGLQSAFNETIQNTTNELNGAVKKLD